MAPRSHRLSPVTPKTKQEQHPHTGDWEGYPGGASSKPHEKHFLPPDASTEAMQPSPGPYEANETQPDVMADPYIPFRGGGPGIYHGVVPNADPMEEHHGDQWDKREMMANKLHDAPPVVQHEIPIPVVIVEPEAGVHTFRTYQAVTFAVGTAVVVLAGKDMRRRKLTMYNMATAASDIVRFGSDSTLLRTSGGMLVPGAFTEVAATQSKYNSGVVITPGANTAIASIAGLAKGSYKVIVQAGFGANPETVTNTNMSLRMGSTDVAANLSVLASANTMRTFVFDDVNMDGTSTLQVVNPVAGSAGSVYVADITATPINAGGPGTMNMVELETQDAVYAVLDVNSSNSGTVPVVIVSEYDVAM